MNARLFFPALLPSFAAALVLWTPDAGRGYAAAPEHEILVQCDASPVLCDALMLALAHRARDAVVRAIPADGPDAKGASQMLVRFHVQDSTQSRLRGHLSWRTGPAPAVSGPSLDLSVVDHTIQNHMLRDFADLLVRESGLPF